MAYQFQFPGTAERWSVVLAFVLLVSLLAHADGGLAADKLTVYSGRAERLIKPVLDGRYR